MNIRNKIELILRGMLKSGYSINVATLMDNDSLSLLHDKNQYFEIIKHYYKNEVSKKQISEQVALDKIKKYVKNIPEVELNSELGYWSTLLETYRKWN